MKHFCSLLFYTVLAASAFGQEVSNLAGAGISYGGAVAGTGIYAKAISGTGTYAFTVLDAVPQTFKPFSVTTSYSAGIAQKLFAVGKIGVFVPTSAGVSYSGSNAGWAWNTGALAVVPLKSAWKLMPNARVVKSSVSGGSGYQLIFGVLFGWGW